MYKPAIAFGLLLFIASCYGDDLLVNRNVKYFKTPKTWYDALDACRVEGMQLLSLHTNEEYNRIREIAKEKKANIFWTAGTDKDDGVFKWATNGQPFSFTRWWPGYPEIRAKLEHCVDLYYTNAVIGIRVDACHLLKDYFCETVPTFYVNNIFSRSSDTDIASTDTEVTPK